MQAGLRSAALLALHQLPGGVPKGYLRVLSFTEDSVLVDQRTVQLRTAALNNYDTLRTGPLVVQQTGYVSVYVGNESAADVYFDDMTIEHRPGLQVQENQYDPVGLDLAGVSGAAPGLRLKNFYQFNGQENQLDLGLSWNHQDWRFFDYQIGRWHVVDPEIENGQESWTPYSFGFDNAVRYADADGLWPDGGGGAALAVPALIAAAEIAGEALAVGAAVVASPVVLTVAAVAVGVVAVGYGASVLADHLPAMSPGFRVSNPNSVFFGALYQSTHNPTPSPTSTVGQSNPGSAASTLPRMKGSSVAGVEKTMKKEGFAQTKKSSTGNATYDHPDGSQVLHHPYGDQKTGRFKTGNNAHLHKKDPSGQSLNDKGQVSNDPNETHIGTRNPRDLPQVRNRPHGAGTQ